MRLIGSPERSMKKLREIATGGISYGLKNVENANERIVTLCAIFLEKIIIPVKMSVK